jgi:hypothetical protein
MAAELPPEVAAAAAIVDGWLKGQPSVLVFVRKTPRDRLRKNPQK